MKDGDIIHHFQQVFLFETKVSIFFKISYYQLSANKGGKLELLITASILM